MTPDTKTIRRSDIEEGGNSRVYKEAIELMRVGNPIGAYNRGVCAIVGDAFHDGFFERVCTIKGQVLRINKPFGTMFSSERLAPFIDYTQVPATLRPIFKDPALYSSRFGSLCFIRVAVNSEAVIQLPHCVLSNQNGRSYIQNWDPLGAEAFEDFAVMAERSNVGCLAVTSMNISGEPEITDQIEAQGFCQEHGISLYLPGVDVAPKFRGSYPIFEVTERGVSIVRYGNIPFDVLKALWPEIIVNENGARGKRRLQEEYDTAIDTSAPPDQIRLVLIKAIINNQ